jgi:hypothetical protein
VTTGTWWLGLRCAVRAGPNPRSRRDDVDALAAVAGSEPVTAVGRDPRELLVVPKGGTGLMPVPLAELTSGFGSVVVAGCATRAADPFPARAVGEDGECRRRGERSADDLFHTGRCGSSAHDRDILVSRRGAEAKASQRGPASRHCVRHIEHCSSIRRKVRGVSVGIKRGEAKRSRVASVCPGWGGLRGRTHRRRTGASRIAEHGTDAGMGGV